MNGVGEPCAREPHARFDRGPLAKLRPRRDGTHAPNGETLGTEPVRPTGSRPANGLPHPPRARWRPERAICAALNSNDRDRQAIRAEFEGARATFHALLESASEEELARPSNGTRWTNRQLLFHMMFGYMVVRALLPLVKIVRRLPDSGQTALSRRVLPVAETLRAWVAKPLSRVGFFLLPKRCARG